MELIDKKKDGRGVDYEVNKSVNLGTTATTPAKNVYPALSSRFLAFSDLMIGPS